MDTIEKTAAKPVARPRPADVVPARPRPVTTVAIVVAGPGDTAFRYSACSADQNWTGTVTADSAETAILDVIKRVRAQSDAPRLRFVVQLPPRSTLWALRDEIPVLMPGVFVERPTLVDEPLMTAARRGLLRRPVTQEPVWVATDGSVRGKVTGYGWLASTGEYGLMGFRHSRKQIGPNVVLVAELRAIAKAVQYLRGRDITVLSDSKLAVAMVQRWMAGDDVLPDGYSRVRDNGRTPGLVTAQRMIFAERDRIHPVWVKAHAGEPLNEGADALARLASRYVLGDSGLDGTEYRCRADDLAETFAAEFNRRKSA
ncbi:ribonuclease H [Mycolicibacterium flavescens]|uniref:Ribonuclease H n=1 Tax=Mycolicibacterium flavescens TaxID=1776 RepID=A0A1E3RN78_MYCFV|nr:RNase H family protein [Mycolicibacterium flavescens]MCV7281737.1 ribonuclease H [Mycolicibacterium flavescens]ODQ90867.1 ribonuclease H [Mycolicibacterium flavescens]